MSFESVALFALVTVGVAVGFAFGVVFGFSFSLFAVVDFSTRFRFSLASCFFC